MTPADASVLRPLSMGQLLDRALRLYRRHFGTYIAIIAIMLAPLMVIQAIITILNIPNSLAAMEQFSEFSSAPNPFMTYLQLMSASSGGGATFLVAMLQFVLVQGLATAALVRAVATSYLGQPMGVFEAYGRSTTSWLRLMVVLVATYILGLMLTAAAIIIPCVGWTVGIGMVVYFFYVLWNLVPPATVLEAAGPTHDFAGLMRWVFGPVLRAWALARRRFWWMFGFMLILLLFSALIISGPVALVQFGASTALTSAVDQDPRNVLLISTLVQYLTSLVTSLLYLPLQTIAVTLVYFDLRVRTEGLDMAMMAASPLAPQPPLPRGGEGEGLTPDLPAGTGDEEGEPALARILEQPPLTGTRPMFTGTELINFGGIALGAIAVFAVLYGLIFVVVLAAMGASGAF